ncbi:MAG: helix-turn-helix domain-containing protein [Candidatus Aminicenantes bacterium]|nr:helix-turn-helix domain-containing protein [Candidatus Aminicenantes bacterium]
MTVDEAARLLHVHPTNLRRLVSKRKIPFIKKPGLGVKFNPEKLEAWIQEGEVEPEK